LVSLNESEFPLIEINFYLKLRQQLFQLTKNTFKLNLVTEQGKFENKQLKKAAEIVEITHVMGLSHHRILNYPSTCYQVNKDQEK